MYTINPKVTKAKVNGRCEKVKKDGLLNEDDRNYSQIICRRCECIFFPEDVVEYIESGDHPVDLRVMTNEGSGPLETERISWWWYTNDDMDFDTIGWQTIDKKKVLMCADCDLGPIGWRTEDNGKFYVAVERVSYKRVSKSDDDDDEKEEEKPKPKPAPKKTPEPVVTRQSPARILAKQPAIKTMIPSKAEKKTGKK